MVQNIIIFDVGTHHFALDADSVVAIIRAVEVTFLRDMPPPFMGVINYRGAVLPVARLTKLLEVEASVAASHEHMIIATTPDRSASFCVVVDQVTGFATPDVIQAVGSLADELQTGQRVPEVARIGTEMIPILHLEALIRQNGEALLPLPLLQEHLVGTQI